MFGLRTTDSQGKIQHAMKKTRFLSNSGKILRELKVKCDGSHTHQHLVGGRAGPAAVYPPALCRAICRGLVKQIHLKEARVNTLLRVDESWEKPCIPEEEEDREAMEKAWDDVSGKELNARQVREARAREMKYIDDKMVWRKSTKRRSIGPRMQSGRQ